MFQSSYQPIHDFSTFLLFAGYKHCFKSKTYKNVQCKQPILYFIIKIVLLFYFLFLKSEQYYQFICFSPGLLMFIQIFLATWLQGCRRNPDSNQVWPFMKILESSHMPYMAIIVVFMNVYYGYNGQKLTFWYPRNLTETS